MKNDHRSKFSILSNGKEKAWKNQGFNGIRTRDLREYRCNVLELDNYQFEVCWNFSSRFGLNSLWNLNLATNTSFFSILFGDDYHTVLRRMFINKKPSKVKNNHRSKFSKLSSWTEEAWKNQGFNGIRTRDLRDTGAMLYQLSYEARHWERGQFVEFVNLPWGVKWCEVYMK